MQNILGDTAGNVHVAMAGSPRQVAYGTAASGSQATITIAGASSKRTHVTAFGYDLVPNTSAAAGQTQAQIVDSTSSTTIMSRYMGDAGGLEANADHVSQSGLDMQSDTAAADSVKVQFAAGISNYLESVWVEYYQQ